nr:5692_t:CDS:2 [Entrophospora candida]
MNNLSVKLLSSGIIDPDLHYGVHARTWWFQASKNLNNICYWNPICVGMKTQFILNSKNFILHVIKGNKLNALHPGYCCQCDEISSEVESNPTDAVSNLYQKIFQSSTRISGIKALGFESNDIVQELLLNIEFRPYSIQIERINLFIYGLGISKNKEFCGAGNGYISSFNYKFSNKWWLEILNKHEGKKISGLNNNVTSVILEELKTLACTPNDWDDVELYSFLEKIYPLNHKFSDRELQAWSAMLRAVSCTNITPFSNKISPVLD